MREFLRECWWVLVLTAFVVTGLVLSAASGVQQGEITECHQWEQQAAEFSGFYLVQWQADQCKAHSIIINAPIK